MMHNLHITSILALQMQCISASWHFFEVCLRELMDGKLKTAQHYLEKSSMNTF